MREREGANLNTVETKPETPCGPDAAAYGEKDLRRVRSRDLIEDWRRREGARYLTCDVDRERGWFCCEMPVVIVCGQFEKESNALARCCC